MVLVTRQACRPSGPSSEPWPLSFTPPNGESAAAIVTALMPTIPASIRSEEHTSELQSQSNLVCRLLLEKKRTLPSWRRRTVSAANGSPLHSRAGAACLRAFDSSSLLQRVRSSLLTPSRPSQQHTALQFV